MQLIVQPTAGSAPIMSAIKRAKKSVDVLIFRLDRTEMADALAAAVRRGVSVRALVAYTNRGGEKNLRKLEMRLLENGVTVARTADDLVRYHGKMMIVDRELLHVYGFNFTALDIKHSRSFGIVTKQRKFVEEAVKLFDADCARQTYCSGYDRFVVSPVNARERLTEFIEGANRQLVIYDPKISDAGILRALTERKRAGVDIKIIGKVGREKTPLTSEKYPGKRFHVRAMVRDGRLAFVGSQSLRKLELERRREIGLVVGDAAVVKGILQTFEQDWAQTEAGRAELEQLKKAAQEQDKAVPKTATPEPDPALVGS